MGRKGSRRADARTDQQCEQVGVRNAVSSDDDASHNAAAAVGSSAGSNQVKHSHGCRFIRANLRLCHLNEGSHPGLCAQPRPSKHPFFSLKHLLSLHPSAPFSTSPPLPLQITVIMSRFVRHLQVPHVYPNVAKKEACYENVKVSNNAWDTKPHRCAMANTSRSTGTLWWWCFRRDPHRSIWQASDIYPLCRGHMPLCSTLHSAHSR